MTVSTNKEIFRKGKRSCVSFSKLQIKETIKRGGTETTIWSTTATTPSQTLLWNGKMMISSLDETVKVGKYKGSFLIELTGIFPDQTGLKENSFGGNWEGTCGGESKTLLALSPSYSK